MILYLIRRSKASAFHGYAAPSSLRALKGRSNLEQIDGIAALRSQ
jgi:hypothetical protein